MSKFKVGDKVKILDKDTTFGWVSVMEELLGTEQVIKQILQGDDRHPACYIVGGYGWAASSLELIEEPKESKLKVGDRVRVKPGDYHGFYFSGDVGTVVEHPYKILNGPLIYVRFSGHHNAKVTGEGYWWAEPAKLDKLPVHYSSTFTESAKAEPTTGHAPNSGLQKHSLGELYPLAVVGYGDSPMIFVLENLETGQVAGDGGYVRQWGNADHVVEFAKKYDLRTNPTGKSDDWGDDIVWITGRPINVDGYLEMPKITRKVQF